jgi:hypothetical protein
MCAEGHTIEITFSGLDVVKSAFNKFDKTKAKYCNSENTSPVITCSERQVTKKMKLAKNVALLSETIEAHSQPHRHNEVV